jgi:glutaryl-CoA dehydrogenase
VRESAATYCRERLVPLVIGDFRRNDSDKVIFREMGAWGLLGATIPKAYGGACLNYVFTAL